MTRTLSLMLIALATLCACEYRHSADDNAAADDADSGVVLHGSGETTAHASGYPGFPGNHSTRCLPMPPPAGNIIRVSADEVARLRSVINRAKPGDSILLEDGHYPLDGSLLRFNTPGVTLRSASGDPRKVILDGGYASTQIISIAASDTTIAEITIRRPATHAIHVFSSDAGNTDNTEIYRVHIEDPRQQAIKINHHAPGYHVDNGSIACASITLSDAGRSKVSPVHGGCYTGGIDAHRASGWVVRDSFIEGFWCDAGLSEHAIHFWRGGRDTLVENNVLVDNARGIGFGLSNRGEARTYPGRACFSAGDGYIGHYRGIIRNNLVVGSSAGLLNSKHGFDCGVCLASACEAIVVHNTVASAGDMFAAIESRFPESTAYIANNLMTHGLRNRNGGSSQSVSNLKHAGLELFRDAARFDFRLSADADDAIDQGAELAAGLADRDAEGELRQGLPDIGADEYLR